VKKALTYLFIATAISQWTGGAALAAEKANDHFLPENFTVYLSGGQVINWNAPGTRPVVLPTTNLYREKDGGYVACYSRQEAESAYSVGGDIYVMGQVRLRGKYEGRIFQPRGYRGQDISALAKFKSICSANISACSDGTCWAGGDTGGWFGIQ
jgi:hypothetical protein